MFNRFFRKKKEPAWIDRQVVWGLWVPRWLQVGYKGLAYQLNVPISVLAGHVLRQWLQKNNKILQTDIVKQKQFSLFLADKYLKKSEDED